MGPTTSVGRLYFDALGDPGRANLSQPSYASCFIWTPHRDQEIEEMFAQLRRDLGLRAGFEFHATQITKEMRSADIRRRFFELLIAYGFVLEAWIAEVVKEQTKLPLNIDGKMLLHEVASRVLVRMPRSRIERHILTIDDKVASKKASKAVREMATYVKRAMQEQGLDYSIGSVRARESHRTPGLQLADFLVAALVKPWPECRKSLASWSIEYWRV